VVACAVTTLIVLIRGGPERGPEVGIMYSRVTPVAAAVAGLSVALPAMAANFDAYADTGTRIALPPIGAGSFGTSAAVLGDGRLIAATGDGVFVESGPESGLFDLVATFDPAHMGAAVDPSFVRVSPSGSRIAVGGGFGKPIAVFDASDLGDPGTPAALTSGDAADYFAVSHFDAAWYGDDDLAITFGAFGEPAVVSLLDLASDPAAPENPTIIEGIGGSSGGIAFDTDGYLFTGNGFTGDGPSDTGDIHAFAPDVWQAGLTGDAADFETDGIFIADLLSAGSLGFDAEGNMFVGGGDFAGDMGFFALVNECALADALAGLEPIDTTDPDDVRRFDPEGSGMIGSYVAAFNPVTGSLYGGWADGFSEGDPVTWAVHAVPGPSTLALMTLAATAGSRRRRSPSHG
jgi:hypothetical protein